MELIDTHCHLTDERLQDSLADLKVKMLELGFTKVLNAGYEKQEWLRQTKLKHFFEPIQLITCWGLHPVYINNQHQDILVKEFEFLKEYISQYQVIGETGLDFRKAFKDSSEKQVDFFNRHIQLSIEIEKPMILHIVQSHDVAISLLKKYKNILPSIVHSFSGSLENAREYIRMGFLISFSPSICYGKSKKMLRCIQEIPEDSFLIESDAPDQAPPDWDSPLNNPESILSVAKYISEVKNLSHQKIIKQSNANFLNFLNF